MAMKVKNLLVMNLRRGDMVVALTNLDPNGANVKEGQVGVVFEEYNAFKDGGGPMVRWNNGGACNVYDEQVIERAPLRKQQLPKLKEFEYTDFEEFPTRESAIAVADFYQTGLTKWQKWGSKMLKEHDLHDFSEFHPGDSMTMEIIEKSFRAAAPGKEKNQTAAKGTVMNVETRKQGGTRDSKKEKGTTKKKGKVETFNRTKEAKQSREQTPAVNSCGGGGDDPGC